MKYGPKNEHADWHERAMKRAESENIHSTLGLYLEARDTKRLADRIQQTGNEDRVRWAPTRSERRQKP